MDGDVLTDYVLPSSAGNSSIEIEVVVMEEIVEIPPEPSRPAAESAVYVGVGKGSSSMDALCWALEHEAHPPLMTVVFLIHVFPEVHYIPTPLGRLHKSQVNPQQLDSYMTRLKSKRREMLHKFINRCRSCGVEVETILIESDQIAKSIVDLIDILRIQRLIIGASKSSVREKKHYRSQRKLKRGARGGGKEEQILKDKPDYCDVKIICDSKDVTATDQMPSSPTSPSAPPQQPTDDEEDDDEEDDDDKNENQENSKKDNAVRCGCF